MNELEGQVYGIKSNKFIILLKNEKASKHHTLVFRARGP